MTTPMISQEHQRVLEGWHAAISAQDLDALMSFYAEDATIDSAAVLVLERDPSGILHGKNALRSHFAAFFKIVGPLEHPWFRLPGVISHGPTLVWEYPSAGPSGEQLDVVESFDIQNGLIQYHRVYWGRVGFNLLRRVGA